MRRLERNIAMIVRNVRVYREGAPGYSVALPRIPSYHHIRAQARFFPAPGAVVLYGSPSQLGHERRVIRREIFSVARSRRVGEEKKGRRPDETPGARAVSPYRCEAQRAPRARPLI